jgi:hypothetical protein
LALPPLPALKAYVNQGTIVKMAGRPTSYTPEIEAEILERLAAGESLRAICQDPHLPSDVTVRTWVIENREGISARYSRARAIGVDAMRDQTLADAEMPMEPQDVPAAQLKWRARTWHMAKMRPEKYGDRTVLAGDKENPLELNVGGIERLKTRIDSLIARGATGEPPPEPE